MSLEIIASLEKSALSDIHDIAVQYDLEQWKSKFLGKKSPLQEVAGKMASLSPEEKKQLGQAINDTKNKLLLAYDKKQQEIATATLNQQLEKEGVDLTLPARPNQTGKLHPISHTIEEALAILGAMDFTMATGPEIESDFYNFTALNIPESHPARQMQDTLYIDSLDDKGNNFVLRTHTSPVQIRAGRAMGAPLRVMAPGRVYRADSDMTHTPMFHQIEGLVIDKAIHFGHLKGCLFEFCRLFFEVEDWSSALLRFRPSYFPFTEPSAEVDIASTKKGDSVIIGSGDSWVEILGAGMVHPKVIENIGLDPQEWQGFAFGMGVERLAMLKYGMPDLRDFFHGDSRWLKHYGFSSFLQPSLLTGLTS